MEGRKSVIRGALVLAIACFVVGVVPAALAAGDPFRVLGSGKPAAAPARSASRSPAAAKGKLAITRIPAAPETLRQLGVKKAVQSFEFNDATGSHVLVLTREYRKRASGSDPQDNPEETIDLAARLFSADGEDDWQEDWKIRDSEQCVSLDIAGEFFPQATSITDLDSDGVAEVTVAYHSICAGGLDPHSVKVIMREQGDKYAVRGDSLVDDGRQPYGGEHRFDPAAETLPPAFRKHLGQVWKSVYRLPTCQDDC